MKQQRPAARILLSDEEILALLALRDERALGELDRRYRPLAHSVTRGILPDERDREECINDAYLKLWNAIPPAAPQSLRAYLVQVLRHTALDRYEENRRACRIPVEAVLPMEDFADFLPAPAGEGVDEEIAVEELTRLIDAFLRGQSERRRFIFMEYCYLCTPVPVIAETLGVSVSAVYKELSRTKIALKEHLLKNGVYI